MDYQKKGCPRRTDILKRFIRTLICMFAFELIRMLTYAIVFVQFAISIITGKHSAPLRNFGNKLSRYTYEILRYATLNNNRKPFPFSNLPAEHQCEHQASDIDYS
ncbi:DUF4389 domain-containing protein [Maridesulfovibrio zosterae]|uniref:DUF4389 domain-containing protein n=1 Tax=Maridesulfovibrio zosterae TaxID=82171 RepID=UPI0003FCE9B7|nr:DUF4389 domain-containing protein [Maridesulfovibrio zosterae]